MLPDRLVGLPVQRTGLTIVFTDEDKGGLKGFGDGTVEKTTCSAMVSVL